MWGRINHVIHIQPLVANGIVIQNEEINGKNNIISQVNCVVCLKKDPNIRSKASIPIRRTSKNMYSAKSICSARWFNDNKANHLKFDSKLSGKKAKVYEFSIRLQRGDEEIEIGVTSLTFVGVLLGAELEIPIFNIDSKEGRVITMNSKQGNGIFRSNEKGVDSKIVKDIRSQLCSNADGLPKKTFKGGDGGRSYSLRADASIRVKCMCIPTNGKIDLETMKDILQEKMLSYEKISSQSNETNETTETTATGLDSNYMIDTKHSRGRSFTLHPVYNFDSISLSVDPSSEFYDKYKRTDSQNLESYTERPSLKKRVLSDPNMMSRRGAPPSYLDDKFRIQKDKVSLFAPSIKASNSSSDILGNSGESKMNISFSTGEQALFSMKDETSSTFFRGLPSNIANESTTDNSTRHSVKECNLPICNSTFSKGRLLLGESISTGGSTSYYTDRSTIYTDRSTIYTDRSSTINTDTSLYTTSFSTEANTESTKNSSRVYFSLSDEDEMKNKTSCHTFTSFIKRTMFCQ